MVSVLTFQTLDVLHQIESGRYYADLLKAREKNDYAADIEQLGGCVPIWVFSPINWPDLKVPNQFTLADFKSPRVLHKMTLQMSLGPGELNEFELIELSVDESRLKVGRTRNNFVGCQVISYIDKSDLIAHYKVGEDNSINLVKRYQEGGIGFDEVQTNQPDFKKTVQENFTGIELESLDGTLYFHKWRGPYYYPSMSFKAYLEFCMRIHMYFCPDDSDFKSKPILKKYMDKNDVKPVTDGKLYDVNYFKQHPDHLSDLFYYFFGCMDDSITKDISEKMHTAGTYSLCELDSILLKELLVMIITHNINVSSALVKHIKLLLVCAEIEQDILTHYRSNKYFYFKYPIHLYFDRETRLPITKYDSEYWETAHNSLLKIIKSFKDIEEFVEELFEDESILVEDFDLPIELFPGKCENSDINRVHCLMYLIDAMLEFSAYEITKEPQRIYHMTENVFTELVKSELFTMTIPAKLKELVDKYWDKLGEIQEETQTAHFK